MELSTLLAISSIVFFAVGTIVYFRQAKPTTNDLLEVIKEPLLMLFLYAEKKGWSGPEKMEYCVNQILKIIPIKMDKDTVEKIAQKLYKEYRELIISKLEDEEEAE